jgi:Ca2+-binding RTX toxin-like protein
MMKRFFPRLVILTLIALVVISVLSAVAAGNIVPVTRLDEDIFAVTIGDFTPAACSGLGVTNLVTGNTFIFGTNGNDLILAGSGVDWIFALGGADCIVGGGGNDIIWAGGGTDVCIGGPGTDTFNQCETEIQ